MSGIADPMNDLPDLHALLDVTEQMWLEGMEDEKTRNSYWLKMYRPPAGMAATGKAPKGWSAQDELEMFRNSTAQET